MSNDIYSEYRGTGEDAFLNSFHFISWQKGSMKLGIYYAIIVQWIIVSDEISTYLHSTHVIGGIWSMVDFLASV